jgi:PAS domain S-box-containing protein
MGRIKKPKTGIPAPIESTPHSNSSNNAGGEDLFGIVARSQKSFRELIDSFDRLAFNLSTDGCIQVINRQFADVLGLPFSAIVGHSVEEFIASPKRQEIARILPRFLEERFWSGVVPVRWKGKAETRYYDCSLFAVVKNGAVEGVSGLARDVSAQREAESRFSDLFETLHEGVYFSAPGGELLDVNPAMVRMLGYESKEELLRQPVERHFTDPEERANLAEGLRKSGSVRDIALSLRRKDGSFIRVLNSSVAIRNSAGEFVRFQGSLVDITERNEMERRLREEQEFVRRLVACFPDIIVVLDPNGRYTFVSPRVEEFLGYTPHDYLGAELRERPHPEDRDSLLEFFRKLTSGEVSVGALEYRTAHKNGSWRTVRAHASPLTNAEGQIIGVVASARDVTEAKRMEHQLMQSEKLAAIGQMVSGVAHELNNPLTAILGVSDLLLEKAPDDDARRQLQLIHKQARKAAELVQGLLMFSRPSTRQNQRVRVTDLIDRAIGLQRAELESRRIIVEVDAPSDLPLIQADPQHMTQVFVNLISNAIQAIAAVSDHGRIGIHVKPMPDQQEIVIDDDGPGVRADIRSKIFDPFFTTHRTSGGSGLGLTICLVIVKEHGGMIEAQTSPSGGARFRIVLPSANVVADMKTARPANRERLKERSVLIVEDEAGIRELLEHGLTEQGAEVETVEAAEIAWNRMTIGRYDLVLCDHNLGNESGSALIERILKSEHAHASRFVLMTGELLSSEELSGWEKRGVRVLQKPFQLSELTALLQEVLSNAAADLNPA